MKNALAKSYISFVVSCRLRHNADSYDVRYLFAWISYFLLRCRFVVGRAISRCATNDGRKPFRSEKCLEAKTFPFRNRDTFCRLSAKIAFRFGSTSIDIP
jgi:hypothetical protein